jgi:LacI family transcriptional regulator
MQNNRVTLKDISARSGASLSTVHRALYNKAGVSDEVRKAIVETAEKMGYKANYVASSLKRKTLRLAVVLPSPDLFNKYFYRDLWKGLRDFCAETQEFNVEFLEFPFSGSDGNLAKKLEEVYRDYSNDISGLITISLKDPSISYQVDKFASKNIPVVFIVSDLQKSQRLCCVRAHDKIAGSLAAELINNFTKGSGKVIVSAGDIVTSSHYCNVEGFEEFLAANGSLLSVTKIYDSENTDSLYNSIENILKSSKDICALYSCNARDTVAVCKAVVDMGLQGKVCIVGSDIFEESVQMLKSGVIQAIIYKNPYRQAYLGMKTLFNYVLKNESPSNDTIFVIPTIVMKSNLEFSGNNEAYSRALGG